MPYTPEKPQQVATSEELRGRIPGWGVDLDPKDRPSVPRERFDPSVTGAHWEFPDRQTEHRPRERSVEHAFLTPVFGTSVPPRGVSGVLRKVAYSRYSEGSSAHWLLLLAADRVDAAESHVESFLRLRPDNPITESGILGELSRHPVASRRGQGRVDLFHQPLDLVLITAPWVLTGVAGYRTVRRLMKRRSR
jgi:hypothetical protein